MKAKCAVWVGCAMLAAGMMGVLTAVAADVAKAEVKETSPATPVLLPTWPDALNAEWAGMDAYGTAWTNRAAPGPMVPIFGQHRQPAIVLTDKGTLLAFGERYTGGGDVGEHEIVLRRSTDGGKTWEKEIVVFDDGKKNLNGPTPVVDRKTGTIWLQFARTCSDIMLTHSKDDGVTWATPEVLDTGRGFWPGQSHGIQLSTGRLLCPARIAGSGGGFWCYYSDDHGATWQKGTIFKHKHLNAILLSPVELTDGTIYGNMRQSFGNGRTPNYRRDTWSRDGGLTWDPPKPNRALRDADGGTGVKANVIRLTDERRYDRNRVIFCCPAEGGRKNPLVYISYDECKSWSKGKRLLEGFFGYSDLVVLPDMSIGCFFEGGPGKGAYRAAFLRFTVEWLTDGEDKDGRGHGTR